MFTTTVEFTDLNIEVAYLMGGHERRATREEPAEHRYPVIQRCTLLVADMRFTAPFEQLPEYMQEEILEACREDAAESLDDIHR
jgi:hypothetical protein